MPQVQIPQSLFDQIETVLSATNSPDEFVVAAVREKLLSERRKGEFYRISDESRAAMMAKSLTEADVLADFEATRDIQRT